MKEYKVINEVINLSLDKLYNKLYDNNEDIMETTFKFNNYEKGEWNNNKRIDRLELEMEDLPDMIKQGLLNNSNILNIEFQNTLLESSDNVKYIKTKIKIKNIKSKIIGIINDNTNIIKMKHKVKLNKIDNNNTLLNFHGVIKTYLPHPYANIIDTFGLSLCKKTISDFINYLKTKNF